MMGVATGTTFALWTGQHVPVATLLAAVALALVGLIDDRKSLPVVPRLLSQVCVGAILGVHVGGPLWGAIGALLAPAVVNIVNFMDGINGITALTMTLWGITVAAAASAAGSQQLALLGATTAGAALGFLPWNAPNSKLFLGDIGSYLFGALATGGIILGAATSTLPSPILLAPLSVYFVDTSYTLIRRALRGENLLEAHREHVYQQIVSHGISHVKASSAAGLVATLVTLSWLATKPLAATTLSALLLVGYLMIPTIISRHRGRHAQRI